MLTSNEVKTSLEAAKVISQLVPNSLSSCATRIYTALCATALKVMQDRQYSTNVTEITLFCPAESVALAVGCHPATLYRHLPALADAGLVASKGHYCTHNGAVRQDGTVWTIRLSPVWGSKARCGYDWLKRSYRSLSADIESGRTAYSQMRQSKDIPKKPDIDLEYILVWALSGDSKTYVKVDSRKIDLATIFDVGTVKKSGVSEKIFEAAKSISSVLNDNQSTNFYMAVLWNLLKIRDRTGKNYFDALHLMVSRVVAEANEGGLRCPAALLVSRIKAAGFLDSG